MKATYDKYHFTTELTKNNDHPLIYEINTAIGLPKKAHYCGSTIVFMLEKSGLRTSIPEREMGLARNWRKHGEIVWDAYNGWKQGTQRTPKSDEIFIVLFNWNGRNHVGVVLQSHGGINFITGEGNTSDIRVRKIECAETNAVNTKNRQKLYVPTTNKRGIFSTKERYATVGLQAVIRYKCY